MKANEKYFRVSKRITGWVGNRGIRLTYSFPEINAWSSLMVSMGVRRSKLWQFNPVRFVYLRSCKGVQIGFGLVHFTVEYHS